MEKTISQKGDANRRNAILVAVLTSTFMITFSSSALNLAIPSIGIEFGSGAILTGWIVTSFILCTAAMSVPFGRLADVTGRKNVFIIGIAIFTVFSGLNCFAGSVTMVIALRIGQGIGASMIFATSMAILVDAYPRERRGKAIGYSTAATYAGLSFGPVFGGLLTHYLGWRSVFFIGAVLGTASLIVSLLALRDVRTSHERVSLREALNPVGILLYVSSILSIMYGFGAVARNGWAWGLILIGIALLCAFIRHELRTLKPVLEVRLFLRNRNFLFSNIAALLNYGATYATGYMLSIYMQLIIGFDAQVSGLVLICQPVVQALLSPVAGRLSDRHSPYRLASFGMGLCAASLLSFVFLGLDSPLYHIMINLAVVGLGFGFFSSPNSNAIMSNVPPADYSVASSILATMRSLGQSASMAVITLIMGLQLGGATYQEASSEQLMKTMHTAFITFSVICAAGIFVSVQRRSKNKRPA